MGFVSVAQRVLLLVSLLLPAAVAAQAPSGPPPEVRRIFDEALAECRSAGGRFIADPTGFYETADFNGDNRPDYVVSPAALHCSAFGYSQHCGSAGCTQIVLISEGNRLRQVYASNIQVYALVTLPNGRQGLTTGMHGSACGRVGAEACYVAMSWNGSAWTTTRLNREPPELAARIAQENAPPPPQPRWEAHAGSAATGPLALLRGHTQIPLALVRCVEGVPVMMLRLGANAQGGDLPLPPPGRQLVLALGSQGEEQLIRLDPLSEAREFAGAIPPRAYALLAGAGDSIEFHVSSSNGDYWLPTEYLSLDGSTAALRPVAAVCGAGRG